MGNGTKACKLVNRRGKAEEIIFSWQNDSGFSTPHEINVLNRYSQLKNFGGQLDSNAYREFAWPPSQGDTMWMYVHGAVFFGPYAVNPGSLYIITTNGAADCIVSVDLAVKRGLGQFDNQRPDHADVEPSGAEQVGAWMLTVASILLGGLSTGFSAMGAKFAVSAGTAGILGMVFGTVQGATRSEVPPPRLDEIGQVVRRELAMSEVRGAVTTILATVAWFHSVATQATGGLDGRMPEKLAEDVESRRKSALDVTDEGSFACQLALLRDNPDLGQWALAELIAGTTIFITLEIARLGLTYLPELMAAQAQGKAYTLPEAAIQGLIDEVKQLRDGIDAARQQFAKTRTQAVVASGIPGTPESIAVIKAVTAKYVHDAFAVCDQEYASSFPKGSECLGPGASYENQTDKVADAMADLDRMLQMMEAQRQEVVEKKWPSSLIPLDP